MDTASPVRIGLVYVSCEDLVRGFERNGYTLAPNIILRKAAAYGELRSRFIFVDKSVRIRGNKLLDAWRQWGFHVVRTDRQLGTNGSLALEAKKAVDRLRLHGASPLMVLVASGLDGNINAFADDCALNDVPLVVLAPDARSPLLPRTNHGYVLSEDFIVEQPHNRSALPVSRPWDAEQAQTEWEYPSVLNRLAQENSETAALICDILGVGSNAADYASVLERLTKRIQDNITSVPLLVRAMILVLGYRPKDPGADTLVPRRRIRKDMTGLGIPTSAFLTVMEIMFDEKTLLRLNEDENNKLGARYLRPPDDLVHQIGRELKEALAYKRSEIITARLTCVAEIISTHGPNALTQDDLEDAKLLDVLFKSPPEARAIMYQTWGIVAREEQVAFETKILDILQAVPPSAEVPRIGKPVLAKGRDFELEPTQKKTA